MNPHKQSGLSLIEVMVAVVISSILILGVTDLFNSAFMSGRSNSQVARMQDSGRLALEIIGADAHRAGLWSCSTNNWENEPVEDAVTVGSNGTSISFKYVPFTSCDTATTGNRAPETVTYSFNDGLKQTVGSGTAQPLLDDVTGTFTLLPDPSDAATANAVNITITVAGDDANFAARSFSATYEFKNKLIARD